MLFTALSSTSRSSKRRQERLLSGSGVKALFCAVDAAFRAPGKTGDPLSSPQLRHTNSTSRPRRCLWTCRCTSGWTGVVPVSVCVCVCVDVNDFTNM